MSDLHRSVVAAAVVAGLLGALAPSARARVDLTGHVLGPGNAPVAGVTVSIYTAGPRAGLSPTCPSCYADCAKVAVSDRDGAFTIRGLDDSLLFRVLAVARGYAPRFADRVDPRRGSLIVRMTPRDTTRLDPMRTARGRVIAADGGPAVGALVEVLGERRGNYGMYGQIPGTDPLAVCDQDGAYVLVMRDSACAPIVRVRARDHAPRFVEDLPAPPAPGRIELSRGAVVEGVVLRDGRPVPGAAVALAPDGNRYAANAMQTDTIAADAAGRYRFQNLPCDVAYRVTVAMGSLPDGGATRHVSVTLGDADSIAVASPLVVERGRRLAGRVLLSDRHAIPAGSRLAVSCSGNNRAVPISDDGRFEVPGLPPEEVTVSVAVAGYHLSPAMSPDIPHDRYGFSLGMTRDRDMDIVLDPDPAPRGGPTPALRLP